MSKTTLKEHIKKLKEQSNKTSIAQHIEREAIIFWGDYFDKGYLPDLKPLAKEVIIHLNLSKVETISEIKLFCKKKNIYKIISDSVSLLSKVLSWDKRKAPSLQNYTGSFFRIPADTSLGTQEVEIVIIPSIKQLKTVPYAPFIISRCINKFTNKDKWFKPTEFSWELLKPNSVDKWFNIFEDAFLISIDIETFKENATIRCISYTAFLVDDFKDKEIYSYSVVLPLDSEFNLSIMRKWNWELKAPKVFQGGMYDISYLSRYSAPVYNYLYDTANMFHSWYSELPKDLGFLNSFFIREATYWKDLSETNDLYEYYKYNALDSWGTGNCLLAMMLEIPSWAIQNYLNEFPLIFPCHMAEMRGIERDMEKKEQAIKEIQNKIAELSTKLDTILGVKGFNVKSNKQMMQLLTILGCKDLKGANVINIQKARFRHPLNARILKLVIDIREQRELLEKYLQTGDKTKEFHRLDGTGNKVLFSLKPHGTDSSRLASRSHHFWCGLQIQNIPNREGHGGKTIKATFKADRGFAFGEVDLEQAESRDTAYIAGEEKLIDAVENSADFHSMNASNFFGIPFEKIYDVSKKLRLDKPLIDIAKRVNHGANYNMGAVVLVETMGEEKISEARKLLGLPAFWTFKRVAEYLLERFHNSYPGIKNVYYKGVVKEILETKMLKHHIIEPDGSESKDILTRYCFGDPVKNKRHLNSYVSHPPQSLNARTLNKAWMKVFYEIAMNPYYIPNFKLIAQIHDSILFQYRIGHEYIGEEIRSRMEIPVIIRGYDKKIRTFTVPAEAKIGTKDKPAIYWSELG